MSFDHAYSNAASRNAEQTAWFARACLIDVEQGGHLWPDAVAYLKRAQEEIAAALAIEERRAVEQDEAA